MAKKKVTQLLTQARESLKVLETLEKETLAKARTFVQRNQANERIRASLKSLGLATRAEVETLETKVERLTLEIEALNRLLTESAAPKKKKRETSTENSPSH